MVAIKERCQFCVILTMFYCCRRPVPSLDVASPPFLVHGPPIALITCSPFAMRSKFLTWKLVGSIRPNGHHLLSTCSLMRQGETLLPQLCECVCVCVCVCLSLSLTVNLCIYIYFICIYIHRWSSYRNASFMLSHLYNNREKMAWTQNLCSEFANSAMNDIEEMTVRN